MKNTILFLIFFNFLFVYSQQFSAITSLKGIASSMFNDTVRDQLHIYGGISYLDSLPIVDYDVCCFFIVDSSGIKYDSSIYSPRGNFEYPRTRWGNAVYSSRIDVAGITDAIPGDRLISINDTDSVWTTIGMFNKQSSSIVNFYTDLTGIYVLGGSDTLYATDTSAGVYSPLISRYDGSQWHTFPPIPGYLPGYASSLQAACRFQGDLYVAGRYFTDIDSFANIARWDGSAWHPVGNGLPPGWSSVADMVVWEGKLVVAGWFHAGQVGAPGNFIARWDGTQWDNMGGGFNEQVQDLAIYQGELYAGGRFTEAGGNPAPILARWDGAAWQPVISSAMNEDNSLPEIYVMEPYHGDLYLGGRFNWLNGVRFDGLARYTGLNTVSDASVSQPAWLGPNPVASGEEAVLHLSRPSDYRHADLVDATGRVLRRQPVSATETLISTEGVAPGIYSVVVRGATNATALRLLVW